MTTPLRAFCCVAVLALSSCKSITTSSDQQLTPNNWVASGKVSVFVDKSIYPQAARSQQTLRFLWQQQDADYLIELSGSFGLGKTKIKKQDGIVSISRGSKILDRATNAESLLAKITGLQLPISGLQYWILGLPSTSQTPSLHSSSSLNCSSKTSESICSIADFSDQGWNIEILSTQAMGKNILPLRLKASTEGITFNAVITQWDKPSSHDSLKSSAWIRPFP